MHTLYTLIMPSRGSKHHVFRGITDEEWEAFDHATERQGTNRSAVIRDYIRYYLHLGKQPRRPPQGDEEST